MKLKGRQSKVPKAKKTGYTCVMKMNKKLRNWIIGRLAANTSRDDIILRLVEELNISWSEAEAMLLEVQEEDGLKVEQSRAPMMAFFALAILAGGIGLILYGLYPFVQIFVVQKTPFSLVNLSIVTLRYGPFAIYYAPTGLAMVVGSMMGLSKVWGTLLDTLFSQR